MKLWLVETEEDGLTRYNWFEHEFQAKGFCDLTGASEPQEVTDPSCETPVGGSRYVQPSPCGSAAVNLVDGEPICRFHMEQLMLDVDMEEES